MKDRGVNDLWVVLRKPPRAIFDDSSNNSNEDSNMSEMENPVDREVCHTNFVPDQNIDSTTKLDPLREEIPSVIIEKQPSTSNRRRQLSGALSLVKSRTRRAT